MTNLVVTDFMASMEVSGYLTKRTHFEALEMATKVLTKINKELAKKVMEDVLSRYDIVITQTIQVKSENPVIAISYRRKPIWLKSTTDKKVKKAKKNNSKAVKTKRKVGNK